MEHGNEYCRLRTESILASVLKYTFIFIIYDLQEEKV